MLRRLGGHQVAGEISAQWALDMQVWSSGFSRCATTEGLTRELLHLPPSSQGRIVSGLQIALAARGTVTCTAMFTWLMILKIVVAIPIVLLLLALVVGCIEKLPVRMFEQVKQFALPSYIQARVLQASGHGYFVCTYGRHKKYQIVAVLLLSVDGRTLAIITEGTIFRMTSKKTTLLSRLSDGGALLTVDDPGTAELDPATRRQIALNADFDALHRRHTEALAQLPPAKPFSAGAGWKEVDDIYRRRADRIVHSGLARYIDPAREFMRYTLIGSFRATIVHGLRQCRGASKRAAHAKVRAGE